MGPLTGPHKNHKDFLSRNPIAVYTMKKIVIILASELKNLELANRVSIELTSTGNEVSIIKLVDLELPLYTSRAEKLHNPADLLANILPCIQQADGFVFISPEYNGGTPPVLTNFLAWVSRSTKNWRENLTGKGAVIATYSAGTGLNVLSAMRLQLSYIGMNVVGRQLVSTSSKEATDTDIKAVIQQLMNIVQ